MKSTAYLAIAALGLCLAAVTKADGSIQQTTIDPALNIEVYQPLQQQDMAYSNDGYIQPCYRWPHPCD